MRSIGKYIKGIALAGAAVAALYAAALGLNHILNNRGYHGRYRHSVTRPDGAFGHTTYGRLNFFLELDHDYHKTDQDQVYVSQQRLLSLSSRIIIDGKVCKRNPLIIDGKVWKFSPVNGVCSGICGEVDGLVDKISVESLLGRCYSLYRYKDYDAHKPEFDEADKLLAETHERILAENRERLSRTFN